MCERLAILRTSPYLERTIMRTSSSFTVKAPSGTTYVVTEIRDRKSAPSLDGSVMFEGLRSYRLSDGRRLNKIGERTFQIPGSDEVLTRI